MPIGYLIVQLHAHLPYIRHPEEPVFLEESWLFEAITETYIPLLTRIQQLLDEGVPARLTMTWSPPLCEMLADPLLQQRYRAWLENLLALADKEAYWKRDGPFAAAAQDYRRHFGFCLDVINRRGGNILSWVRELMEAGAIEAITCGATHGFLPLMISQQAQRAQVAVAVDNFRKHFGRAPAGIWLPECGFAPGIDQILREQGIRFTFVDTHGIYYGTPRPRYGVYAPIFTQAGIAAFGRDPDSSREVWSSECGYPGDGLYREFYRDLGYDGDYEYIRPHLHPDGVRRDLGLKYHRVTGRVQLHEKEPWEPTLAFGRAMQHARDFVEKRCAQCRWLKDLLGRTPVIVSPYDAELFGHWWYEGTQFIESIQRQAHAGGEIQVLTPSGYLELEPVNQVISPAPSSWGDNGYHGVWLNPGNDWIYRHLHVAEERMREVAQRHPQAEGLLARALRQMGRELLLAQSSDWAFIMTTGTSPGYATRRTRDHINRFTGLYDMVMRGEIQRETLATIEWRDAIFQELDWRHWA